MAFQSCFKWGKGLISKLLHPPVMECGLLHGNGNNLSKKASFSQQQILERDSVLSYIGANSWHMRVHHNVHYIVCALSRFLCKSRHSHSRKKKKRRNLWFSLSIILVAMLSLLFLKYLIEKEITLPSVVFSPVDPSTLTIILFYKFF